VELLDRFLAQVSAIPSVWMPFAITLAILVFVVWRIIEWRYMGTIEGLEHRVKLRDDTIQHMEKAFSRPPVVEPSASVDDASHSLSFPAPPTQMSIGASAADSDEAERVFVPDSVTAAYLRDLYRKNTTVQAQKLAAVYLGKWIEVSGHVINVARFGGDDGHLAVSLRGHGSELSSEYLSTTWLNFGKENERVEMLRPGDHVIGFGRIQSIDSFTLDLEDAELVKDL
jgi:hypothetical protein